MSERTARDGCGVYNDLDLLLGGLAAVAGAAAVAVVALVVGGSGFIGLPLAIGSVLATMRRWGHYRAGDRSSEGLVAPDPNYAKWSIASAIGCVALPAVFPNGAYERFDWLVAANAAALGASLLAVPLLRVVGLLTKRIAAARRRGGAHAK